MRSNLSVYRCVLAVLAIVLIACGDDATAPDEKSGAGPVTRIIPPEGGTVTATRDDGTRFRLVFPPDAVRTPTPITVRPMANSGGSFARVALEPAGMVFFQPFDLIITVPEGVGLNNAQLMFRPDDPVYVSTVVDASARTLTTSLRIFGFSDDGTLRIPSSGGAATAQGGSGNQVAASPVNCALVAASAQQRFDGFIALEAFDHALEAALSAGALLQRGVCPEADQFLALAAQAACDGLADAISDAAASNTSTYREFEAAVKPILYWAGLAFEYSEGCASLDTYLDQVDAEIQEWIIFFNTRLGNLSTVDYATFQDLKDEAVTAAQLMTYAASLGLDPAYDKIDNSALQPTLVKMRTTAYNLCVNEKWHYPLSRLTSTGFHASRDIVGVTPPRPGPINPAPTVYADAYNDDDIVKDIQYCATCIEIDMLATSDGKLDSTMAGGGGAPGQSTSTATLVTPTRGKLVLGGEIWSFTCWEDRSTSDELIISLDNTDVLSLRRPLVGNREYLSGVPVEIDIQAAAIDAGLQPKNGQTHELKIRRKVAGCDERLWGEAEYTLFTGTLQWKEPTQTASISFPSEVAAGSSTAVEVLVEVTDQFGVTTPAADTKVDLSVLGGSVALANGKTDSQGIFRTNVTATTVAALKKGGASTQGSLTINATATSYEGIQTQAMHQASVKSCPAVDHRIDEGGTGTYTAVATYGSAKATASAAPDQYSYGEATWNDDFTVEVTDPALDGQSGFVHVKLHFKMSNVGRSLSSPGARVVVGPRNHFSSPYFYVNNFTATGTDQTWEDDWELPITCRFNRVSAPLEVSAEVFARAPVDASVSLSAEITWVQIIKVTTADGTPVGSYTICTGSGTSY